MPLSDETTAKLLALPSLREQAERDARAFFESARDIASDETEVSEEAVKLVTQVYAQIFMRSLSDFDHWIGQAWALREIGRLLGWDVGNEVPGFSKLVSGGSPELCWVLGRKPKHIRDQTSAYFYDGWPYYMGPIRDAWDHWPPQQCKHKTWKAHKVPGLSKHSEYPAAIAAILLHLSGA